MNGNGAAAFRVRWVGRLKVRGAAPGYEVGRDRLRFGKRPFQVLRLYRPRLQWPIYGAGPRTVLESNAKRADEHLELDDLRRATKVVARTLRELLGGADRR